MNLIHLHSPAIRRSLVAAASAFCLLPALGADRSPAAASNPLAAAQAEYSRERAVCLSGNSPEGQATCLKEAGAALEMARHAGGKLPDESPQALAENALRRCKVVSAADRFACEQMAEGHGMVSGSVAGGGVLREYVTVVPE